MNLLARMVFGFRQCLATAFIVTLILPMCLAQTTISTGSIQGTITDQSGAVVGDAKVTITNKGTGQTFSVTTTPSGAYASGALNPGEYMVRVEAKGFKTTEAPVTVQVNVTSSGNFKLAVGPETEVVEVQGSDVEVNTEQATVQGILTSQQIENLPINGRNFLDLAQLEPGVQIQDGGTFDPTKNGFSSVSFGGRFGRTARIELDGLDISDETVGTTTMNVPLGAIEEASLQQSSLDLSTELTSSGSVSLNTKSGTNRLHGDGFYYFRDQSLNAALPSGSKNPFQRNQFGGSLGGPIVKDKLFFFVTGERNKQDLLDPVLPGGAFANLSGSFDSPFRETEVDGRLDYQVSRFKIFYRFTFDQNKSVLPFIPNSFQPFSNVNHARDHVIGVDFNTGSFTHSVRFGYTKFENGIKDAVTGSTIFDPAPGIELAIGGDANCLTAGADQFCSGPNFLAPQATMQSDHQIKYDASKAYNSHVFRFGMGFNHIHGGGFAKFLGSAPAVGAPNAPPKCVAASNCPFSGGASNPLNYPADTVTFGNGQGFSSEMPAFGFPGGGLGPDNRLALYFGDAWKVKPYFTLTYGIRYVRDTGRTDSDIGPIAALNQFNNQFYKNLGARVNQPNHNFAPQVGFAWDSSKKGTTVIRGGIGLFYENSIWNNNLFDRPGRLPTGLFLAEQAACSGGAGSFSFCGQPIGTVASQIVAAQQAYQAASASAATNPSYIGNALADALNGTGTQLFAPNYVTPRSVQMNIGIQHQIRPGMVLTVDYLRNISTHNLLTIDTNQVGNAGHFNKSAALTAISATDAAFGCGPGTGSADINCAINNGARIADYSLVRFNGAGDPITGGLDSGYSSLLGFPAAFTCNVTTGTNCLTPNNGAAFPGINPNVGANQMLFPIGRSVYNGLQTSLREDVHNPFRGAKVLNLQVSYSFSRYISSARDSDFINFATDYANPSKYIGPNGLDRTHQLSFGGTFDLLANLRVSLIGHFDSPLASNVTLPVSGLGGGIFQTDITGDGTGDGSGVSNGGTGDLLPGTNIGAFGRTLSVSGLNQRITNFNNTMVGQPTPAGQVLIDNGLMTVTQLQQLGGVIGGNVTGCGSTVCPLQLAPPGAVGQGWLKSFDFGLSWAYKIKERVELRPGVTFFNVLNFANFDGPAAPFSNILDGTPGSPNGTTNPQPNNLRLGLGSGVNALGAPRQIEFELKLNF
ncbi:MAG: Oar protein [Acidobacteriaceae bacterium]|nr:Oar protein [Acidobacteriaceae bacterium]